MPTARPLETPRLRSSAALLDGNTGTPTALPGAHAAPLDLRPGELFAACASRYQRQSDTVAVIVGDWGMSDVLKGLYARRDDLVRRITAALNADATEGLAANDQSENLFDLQLRLKSVGNQIDVYLSSQTRWERSA